MLGPCGAAIMCVQRERKGAVEEKERVRNGGKRGRGLEQRMRRKEERLRDRGAGERRGEGERERENEWSIAKCEIFFFLHLFCFM